MKTHKLQFFLFSLFLFFNTLAFATAQQSIFDIMHFKEELAVTIEVDMAALTRDIRSDEKHTAVLTFEDDKGISQEWNIKAALRGKFRRMRCKETPPLKLYFDKADLKTAGLSKYDDLKLVNHCYEDKTIAKELILKEYLAYKIYNQITEASFRVQLLKITYKDTSTGKKIKQWGFLIEDTAQLRSRMGANKYKLQNDVPKLAYNEKQVQTMAIFQYMIGNTDWRTDVDKNIKSIEKDGELWAIPYDFDFSGLVNPPYGFANSNFDLTTLTERVYLGDPKVLASLDETILLFKEKEKKIYKLVKSCKHLSLDTKSIMLSYVSSFYEKASQKYISRTVPMQKNHLIGLTANKN